ncbi:hypothetical protein CEXT_321311 [Caerostris extrusa]|uniref:Uncharacterized protein n=1 Tax=Caerostris extrusa TaxID=172846 RepID=A0AAV4P493_CAEEX|nr:hypothetical protein CEXT_321311 [Caerostris extrusa]
MNGFKEDFVQSIKQVLKDPEYANDCPLWLGVQSKILLQNLRREARLDRGRRSLSTKKRSFSEHHRQQSGCIN